MEGAITYHGLEHNRRCLDKANPSICAQAVLNFLLQHPNQSFYIHHQCALCLRKMLPENIGIGRIHVLEDREAGRWFIKLELKMKPKRA